MHGNADKLQPLVGRLNKFTLSEIAGQPQGECSLRNETLVCLVVSCPRQGDVVEFHAVHFVAPSFLERLESKVLPVQHGMPAEFNGPMQNTVAVFNTNVT